MEFKEKTFLSNYHSISVIKPTRNDSNSPFTVFEFPYFYSLSRFQGKRKKQQSAEAPEIEEPPKKRNKEMTYEEKMEKKRKKKEQSNENAVYFYSNFELLEGRKFSPKPQFSL